MKVVNGTSYHPETPDACIKVLELAREKHFRIRIEYGNVETGEIWEPVESGYIGRSTGTSKIPILRHNARSLGGPGLLDHCILMISFANKKDGGVLYSR